MKKKTRKIVTKRYLRFIAFLLVVLSVSILIGNWFSAKVEIVDSGKPPFFYSLFLAIGFMATAIIATTVSYFYWFEGRKAQHDSRLQVDRWARRYEPLFRLPMLDPIVNFWLMRLFMPILAIILWDLFLFIVFTAF